MAYRIPGDKSPGYSQLSLRDDRLVSRFPLTHLQPTPTFILPSFPNSTWERNCLRNTVASVIRDRPVPAGQAKVARQFIAGFNTGNAGVPSGTRRWHTVSPAINRRATLNCP